MATYRSYTHDRLRDRLVDVAIGALVAIPLAILAWCATVWVVMR